VSRRIAVFAVFLALVAGLSADSLPRLALAAGWSGVARTDKTFRSIYPSFSMSPTVRVEMGIVGGLTAYATADWHKLNGTTTGADYETKLSVVYTEYGAGWRFEGEKLHVIPHGGIGIAYLREKSMGMKFTDHAPGFTAGLTARMYFGKKTFFDFCGDYLTADVKMTEGGKIHLGGFRIRVGVGTHIRLFESRYSEE